MRTCTKCGVAKPLDEFPPVRRGQPALQTWCRACFAAANAANYSKNREREKARLIAQLDARRTEVRAHLVAYLDEHPCIDCGEMDIIVLEFDHRDNDKIADISTYANGGRTWARVLTEIAKCDVRCANCHRRKTAERSLAKARSRMPVAARRRYPAIQLDLASSVATRKCRVCGEVRWLSEFPFRSLASKTHHWVCLQCQRVAMKLWYSRRVGREVRPMRPRQRELRAELARYVFNHLAGHPCIECGEADPIVLDFDHLRDKTANVSDLVRAGVSITLIAAELEKCAVRCANCHRRKTAKDRGWYRAMAC